MCNAGVCGLDGGDPCAADTDCASQQCDFEKYCIETGSEACTAANCIDHCCKGGVCQSCTVAADCPLGSACGVGQTCLAPPGAYCFQDSECASGTCAPAALLDFPRCQ